MAQTQKRIGITTVLLGMLLSFGHPARAQGTGRVAGRVLDQTGAALPGVSIHLIVDAGERTTTTDDQGRYRSKGCRRVVVS